MNRRTRRAKQKVTNQQLQNTIDAVRQQTLTEAVKGYSAVVALTLHDNLGFGKTRINRFLSALSDTFKDLDTNLITIEDIEKTLKEDLNLIID